MQLQFFGETVHERLKFWRSEVLGISQAELAQGVNAQLEADQRVAVTTVSNYERRTEPRASFLAALKRAYPEINLSWLVTGEGKPVSSPSAIAERIGAVGAGSEPGRRLLIEQPGLKRFRDLPDSAALVVLAFLDEVRASSPEYEGEHSRPWREFLQGFSHYFFEPFQSPRFFAPLDALSDQEIATYAVAVIAAVRPVVGSLRTPVVPGRAAWPAPRAVAAEGGQSRRPGTTE